MPQVEGAHVVEGGPGQPEEGWGDPAEGGENFSRYELRQVHQDLFATSEAESQCGRAPAPRRGGFHNPEIRRDADGRCWTWGVRVCGNAWKCATCAPRVARRKGEELQAAIEDHRQAGGSVYMLTLTLPHHAGHRCEDVRDAVLKSWSYLLGSSPWKRQAARIQYVGVVRSLETTHGPNGWHWHVHAVLFLDGTLQEEELADCYRWDPDHEQGAGPDQKWRPSLLCWMRDRWARRVRTWYFDREGELARMNLNRGNHLPDHLEEAFGEPSRHHGVRLQAGDRGAGWYVTKMGLGRETTGLAEKKGRTGHRTPFQILHDVCNSWSTRDVRLWREYVAATEGKAHVYWSSEVRKRYRDKEEDQIELGLEEAEEAELVVEVDADLWREAVRHDTDAPTRMVQEAERGGASAVVQYLSRLIDAGPTRDAYEVRYNSAQRYVRLAAGWKRRESYQHPEPSPVEEDPQLDLVA